MIVGIILYLAYLFITVGIPVIVVAVGIGIICRLVTLKMKLMEKELDGK